MKSLLLLAVLLFVRNSGVHGGSVNWKGGREPNLKRSGVVNYVGKTRGEPWPLPQVYNRSVSQFYLSTSFYFHQDKSCPILDSALSRYLYDIGPIDASTCHFGRQSATPLKKLNLYLASPCQALDYPPIDMCENYTLTITQSSVANLTACSVWGALRGLETFRQLLVTESDEPLCVLVNATSIVDYPRFSHRGLMLDTSRHYLDIVSIYQNIEAMAQNRMNVLHWHVVDDQSFPYLGSTFPNLAIVGAYSPHHIYTIEDVQSVIDYARLRGVRVIPEFDTPGHTQSWGIAYPQLLATCYTGGRPNGELGPMDPSNNYVYTFVQQLFNELAQVFPDDYMHLGGDEVPFDCWASNPNITAFMTKMGFGNDYPALENYYIQKILPFVVANKKTGVLWQEIFDNGVAIPSDQAIVHVWKDGWQAELASVTAKGYRALLSSPFYFNYINYGADWENAYVVEPLSFNGTPQQNALVLGGEACMWGEYVDSSNVLTRTWPRASAFAERMWSSKETRDLDYATRRLEEQRCRMIKRGLLVEPVSGPGYCDEEPRSSITKQFNAMKYKLPHPIKRDEGIL